MKNTTYRRHRFLLTLITILIFAAAVSAQTTAFSYQGKLNDGGSAANGSYEMQFKLFNAPAGGTQIGETVTNASVAVINGIFTTTLDFGAVPFDGGAARYLEIAVRPAGNPNPFTILNPRQTINSAPYAIQAKNALTADNSTNSLQLGGIDASEYVTTTSVGNSFVKNDTVLQTGNFNISGNGIVGSSIGIGTTPLAGIRLDVNGNALFRSTGTGGNLQVGTPNGETGMTITGTNRADIRFDGTTLRLFAGSGVGIPANGLTVNTSGNVTTSGNLGVGTFSPDTRLTLNGGPVWTSAGWTASMNLRNGAAIGWDANSSGQRWGIGQSNGGLYFFRSFSSFGTTTSPAEYAMVITDTGNITQPRDKGGLVKAMLYVNANGTIIRCYNGMTDSSTGSCGFSVTRPIVGNHRVYRINFGFQVNDRFVSVTPQGSFPVNISAVFFFVASSPNQIDVDTFVPDVDYPDSGVDNPFIIIIY